MRVKFKKLNTGIKKINCRKWQWLAWRQEEWG